MFNIVLPVSSDKALINEVNNIELWIEEAVKGY